MTEKSLTNEARESSEFIARAGFPQAGGLLSRMADELDWRDAADNADSPVHPSAGYICSVCDRVFHGLEEPTPVKDEHGRWQCRAHVASEPPKPRPTIVCLCGSGRFLDAFTQAEFDESMAGKIVLTIGCNTHDVAREPSIAACKSMLDELHLRKIDLADEVLILNVGGYIGDSTYGELMYAREKGKTVRFLEPEKPPEPPSEVDHGTASLEPMKLSFADGKILADAGIHPPSAAAAHWRAAAEAALRLAAGRLAENKRLEAFRDAVYRESLWAGTFAITIPAAGWERIKATEAAKTGEKERGN